MDCAATIQNCENLPTSSDIKCSSIQVTRVEVTSALVGDEKPKRRGGRRSKSNGIPEKDKAFGCQDCARRFSGASGLWYHRKHHHGLETRKHKTKVFSFCSPKKPYAYYQVAKRNGPQSVVSQSVPVREPLLCPDPEENIAAGIIRRPRSPVGLQFRRRLEKSTQFNEAVSLETCVDRSQR